MNLSGVSQELLKFCLEHSDFKDNGASPNIPQRDPSDYEWLKKSIR